MIEWLMRQSFRGLIYGVILEFTGVTEKKQRKQSVRMASLLSDIESVNPLIRRTVAVRFLRYILELEFEVVIFTNTDIILKQRCMTHVVMCTCYCYRDLFK